jgi:hypothetical protein
VSDLVELALPCRLVVLDLVVGPAGRMSTLEELVARAILAGRTSVEEQAELFAVPRGIVLDVVHSLW